MISSRLRSAIALFAIVGFVGCSTAYQHKSFTGGFDDRMIDDNTAYVTFRGNGFTSQETVEQYLLLRCADVTTAHGYDYFIVGGSAEPSNVGNTNVFGAKVNNKCEPETHRLNGELLLKQDDSAFAEAQKCFDRAIEIARNQNAKSWELRATMSLARLLASQGRRDEARAMLADIYNWFTEGFDTADLKDAKALLDQLGA